MAASWMLDFYWKVQMRMGEWLDESLWMPIDHINDGLSRDLLNHLLGRQLHAHDQLDDIQLEICKKLLSSNGYTYFRMLLAQRGPMP